MTIEKKKLRNQRMKDIPSWFKPFFERISLALTPTDLQAVLGSLTGLVVGRDGGICEQEWRLVSPALGGRRWTSEREKQWWTCLEPLIAYSTLCPCYGAVPLLSCWGQFSWPLFVSHLSPGAPHRPHCSLQTGDPQPGEIKMAGFRQKEWGRGKRSGLCSGICMYIDVGFTVRLIALSFHSISAHLLPNCCQTEAIDIRGLL